MVNVSQQVGGSIGTALLSTIAVTATRTFATAHQGAGPVAAQAAVHGYTTAFLWSAIIFVIGAIVSVTVLKSRQPGDARVAAREAPVPA
jgi:hypothetical protein